MAVLKYKFGVWNQTNANFEKDDTNEEIIAEVLKYALQNKMNVIIVGVSNNWSAGSKYNCNTPTGDFVKRMFNTTSELYTTFLSKQKIFLFTLRHNSSYLSKTQQLLKNACKQTGITVTRRGGITKTGNDWPKCYICFINGKTQSYYDHLRYGFDKSHVIDYFGDNPIGKTWNVQFVDYNGSQLMTTQSVVDGYDAVQPAKPRRDGYEFTGWIPSPLNVHYDLVCFADYKRTGRYYKVTFVDYDFKTLKPAQDVYEGSDAVPPPTPSRLGYVFRGWNPSNVNVTSALTCVATYVKDDLMMQNAITDRMFYSCRALTYVDLPFEITSIGNESFAQCTQLKQISFGSDMQKIGKNAFLGTQISAMAMSSRLTTLAECALSGISKLSHATIDQREFSQFDSNALHGSSITSISFQAIDSNEVIS